ncbi:MAG: hypothetical protein NUV91_09520 [Candidatus Omnitrophica bacterium]|nr:hypothetical protein [Candidatus Omnitrophota bacterium]
MNRMLQEKPTTSQDLDETNQEDLLIDAMHRLEALLEKIKSTASSHS